ncbi:PD-(D/E)XK nuclease family protein [Alkalilimnicola ehrlichii]|uniref:PD-(D/E)XK nuclease family protein n=1 Tax=Alkalilimnicola ehrlichii TaxID=351052 RepID=UPI002868EF16|nr:PD-(D/E)XK nuclease family protein [Alkalilimnicola ehrlichii]
MHDILEHCSFTESEHAELIRETLLRHGFEAEREPVVATMLAGVRNTALDDEGRIRLRQIERHQRLDELEFYYPLAGLRAEMLRRLLDEFGFGTEWGLPERIGRLEFAVRRGYMKGFIDLIFEQEGRYYLVDYKSNWLGARLEDYARERLGIAMAEHGYHLQYLVYLVALHRYLRTRLPDYRYETHIGGVFYLFLRGLSPEHGPAYGVFADRPPQALIEALDQYLATGEWEGAFDVA